MTQIVFVRANKIDVKMIVYSYGIPIEHISYDLARETPVFTHQKMAFRL